MNGQLLKGSPGEIANGQERRAADDHDEVLDGALLEESGEDRQDVLYRRLDMSQSEGTDREVGLETNWVQEVEPAQRGHLRESFDQRSREQELVTADAPLLLVEKQSQIPDAR